MDNHPGLREMKFFILAGGYGQRARPLSWVKPKASFPLHGVPLVKIMLEQLKNIGFTAGFINLHYKSEVIRESVGTVPGLTINYLYETELSGSRILTGALAAMPDEDEFLFIMNGDIFLDISEVLTSPMIREIMETDADGALLLRKNDDPVYAAVLAEKGFFRCIEKNNGGESFMYTGVALFKRKVIESIVHTNFFHSLAAHDFKIKTFVYDGIWLDIGNPRLYFEANTRYKEYIKKGAQSNSLSENVIISPDSHINHCIAWENTEITGGSTLYDCIVTGNLALHDVHYTGKIIYARDDMIKIESI
ncbi:MAG TPA: sugar phosphate nucleotidyltransferase [Candidatus Deferrimicrobium sp.]|nr:sugar phosphate nucleotidyltransferase [Candidatus Deferrimicrobium sp.]